jgi:hypothetical protein
MIGKGIIERAFELAREGRCTSVEDIRRTLSAEHYGQVDAHMSGFQIRSQLKNLIRARGPAPGTKLASGDSPRERRRT